MKVNDTRNLEDVREVLKKNKTKLIALYKAEGVAIGKRDPKDDSYVITVFMEKAGDIPTEPAEVEGIPLKFEVTGKFNAQK